MRSPINIIKNKEEDLRQLKNQSGNLNTNTKVKIYLTLPEFRTTRL